jgi:glycosyltransferase involved in cell wall biosynthesis
MIKIVIPYNFKKGAWGGTNQFLKALKSRFVEQNLYREEFRKGDVILFNSYPSGNEYLFKEILRVKKRYPEKILIYRLDGPISLYRGKDKVIDKIIKIFSDLFADGIIFQSKWSKEQNKRLFGISAPYETVIYNAPDNKIFNRIGKKEFNPKRKIKLIAVSWSPNWRKGFKIYKFLDENLDFSKYEMTFVGNSPLEFKNIKHIKPVESKKLARILKEHDIYITASENDPCSNSLIEALSCGLPAVAKNDGGHPELVQKGGELFDREEDVIEKIERVVSGYNYYQSHIPKYSIESTARYYYDFTQKIYGDFRNKKYEPKRINFSAIMRFYKMLSLVLIWKIKEKTKALARVIWKI